MCFAYSNARVSSLLISAFSVHSTSFSPKPLQTKTAKRLDLLDELRLALI